MKIEEKIQTAIDDTLNKNPALKDANGKTAASISIGVCENGQGVWAMSFLANKLGDFKISSTKKTQAHLGKIDDNTASVYKDYAAKLATEKGFIIRTNPPSKDFAMAEIAARIDYLMDEQHDRYPNVPNQPRGIYRLFVQQPIKNNPDSQIVLEMEPFSHIARAEKEWIPPVNKVHFGGLNPQDEMCIETLKKELHAFLQEHGFLDRHLENSVNQEKIIPDAWLDIDNITKKKQPTGLWSVFLVPSSPTTRSVSFSTGTRDEQQAEEILQEAQYYIAAELWNRPISIASIKKHLEEIGYNFSIHPEHKYRNYFDTRDVFVPKRDNDPQPPNVATLYTPTVILRSNQYTLQLRIAPPRTNREGVNSDSCTSCNIQLGTSDINQANRMRRVVQDALEAWLIEYFSKHPTHSLLTEVQENGKLKIPPQHTPSATAEDKATKLDGRTLGYLLHPALEKARDLMWKVDINPCDVDVPEGKQTLTVRAVHHFDDVIRPEGAVSIHPFDKDIVLHADSLPAAHRFRAAIVGALLNEPQPEINSPPEKSFSTKRGVKIFGTPTTTLVLESSLKKGLTLQGITLDGEGQSALKQLQREAQQEGVRSATRF